MPLDLSLLGELTLRPFSPHDSSLDERRFRDRFARASELEPGAPLLASWSYAPWYSGSFTTPDGVHTFSLYLGGLGTLTRPDGRTAHFLLGE